MTRALAALLLAGCADAPDVTVFAAASTIEVAESASRAAPGDVRVSAAASSVLARQIAAGAPADVLVTADPEWLDWLSGNGVDVVRQSVVATGALVVVGLSGPETTDPAPALAGRVAVADPSHVPAGRYARKALTRLGLWDDVQSRAVYTGDVRAALAAVRTGAVDCAIVYASDVDRQPDVHVVYRFAPTLEIQFAVAQLTPNGRAAYDALAEPGPWRAAGFGPAP